MGNGREAIEWLVLTKKDSRLLLLSKHALDARKYNETNGDVTWETCTLRKWLNESFYKAAFDENEQKHVALTALANEDNPKYNTEGGNDTQDRVFLLSIGEVTAYFNPDMATPDPAKVAKVTEYAKAQGAWANYTQEWYGICDWRLRTVGFNQKCAALVDRNGRVQPFGMSVDFTFQQMSYAVRPAVWLNLEP